MSSHRSASEAGYSITPFLYSAHSYDYTMPNCRGSQSGYGPSDGLKLPPIRDLGLGVGHGPASRESCYQGSAQSMIIQQPLISHDARSTTTSPLPTPEDSFSSHCSENGLLDPRRVVDGDFDGTPEGLERRARTASEIVRRHFGHLAISELLQHRNSVDRSRPLFGSDNKVAPRETSSSQPSATKNSKASKHGRAEKYRRAVHAAVFAEAGKRMPDAIMELASYKRESRRPPGKHPVCFAQLFMYEFDSLLQEKLVSEVQSLQNYGYRSSVAQPNQEQRSDRSRRRRSSTSEDDIVLVESPRKRRRDSPATSITSFGRGSSTFYYEARDNGSGYYHRHNDTQLGELGDGVNQHERALRQRRLATRPRHRQQHSLPSPSPSHGSWTSLSRRSGSPSSAP